MTQLLSDSDLVAVREYRQARLRTEMAKRGIDAVILSDPVNIRYATGTRNMRVFTSRVGMTGEYPYLYHQRDHMNWGYNGVIEPGMTLCVESYIGAAGEPQGVKLEEQILVTESGTELLSNYPFEASLLA